MNNSMIKISPGFQYSINLKYDLDNREKIASYIPVENSVLLLEELFDSLEKYSTERSRMIVGAYGTGKSHLLTVFLSLIRKKMPIYSYQPLLDKLNYCNVDRLVTKIEEYLKNGKPYLTLTINGNGENLEKALLYSLKESLFNQDLIDLVPENAFITVEKTIDLWKKDFYQTYENFLELLLSYDLTLEAFLQGISKYNEEYLNIFSEIYPKLTSGAIFDFYDKNDILTNLQEVVKKIKEHGFKGIYIVIDEFNKYLERSVKFKKPIDLKILQDIAELSNRSEDNQIHLLVITHQHLNQYADNLTEDVVNEWKKVEGRFKTIELTSNSIKTYNLISKIILKDQVKWNDFIKQHKDKFNTLIEKVSLNGLFSELTESELKEWIIYGCYPLHPTTVLALPKISAMLAQNDRTLFTFLSTNEFNTLGSFLNEVGEKDFKLLTLDKIYDYFSVLMKKQGSQTNVFRIWVDVEGALKKIKEQNNVKHKIIKILGILQLLGEYQKLPPTINSLQLSLSNYDSEVLDQAIKELQRDKIIYVRKSDGIINFFQNSDIDFIGEIGKILGNSKYQHFFNVSKILNENFILYPVLAKRYNDFYEMTRYFVQMFFCYNDLNKGINWDDLIKELGYVDGIIANVICETEEQLKLLKNIVKENKHLQVIFVCSKEPLDLTKNLFEFQALKILQKDQNFIEKNPLISIELGVYLDDYINLIEMELKKITAPNFARYYYNGEEILIKTKAQLSKFVSDICYKRFDKTPKINNELINKNNVSTNIKSASKKVIKALYSENSKKPYLGLKGNGPDISIFRSVIKRTGIYEFKNENVKLSHPKETNFKNLLEEIKLKMLQGKEKENTFEEIYYSLKRCPYGLRDGIIPLVLALAMREIKDYLVIKNNGIEEPISPEVLEAVIKNPKNYRYQIVAWDESKEKYLTAIGEIFKDYITTEDMLSNKLYPVGIAIKNWFTSLPLFTRETKNVSKNANNLKRALKSHSLNSKELLFNRLPKILLGSSEEDIDYEKIVSLINEGKIELDNYLENTKDLLIKEIKNIFSYKYERESCISVIKNWYEDLSDKVRKHIFTGSANTFISIIQNNYFNDVAFIEDCCRKITGLRIDDWSDENLETFLNSVKNIKLEIEEFDKKEGGKSKLITVIEIDENGNKIEKTFEKGEISSLGEILLNDLNSSIESFADAISINEKRQILIELLEKLS